MKNLHNFNKVIIIHFLKINIKNFNSKSKIITSNIKMETMAILIKINLLLELRIKSFKKIYQIIPHIILINKKEIFSKVNN